MCKRLIKTVYILVTVACVASTVSAAVSIPVDLKRDSADADFICVGKTIPPNVNDVRARQAAGSSEVTCRFRIDRVLKGDIEPGQTIEVKCLYGQQHCSGYDLVMLKRSGDSFVYSRIECSVPVSEEAYSVYKKSDDVMANLRWEMINSLHSSSEWVVQSALAQAGILTKSDIEVYTKPKINDPDLRTQASALGVCIAAGMDGYVIPALEVVEKLCVSDKNDGSGVPISLLNHLTKLQIKPAMMAPVAAKLHSKSAEVRRIASFMLRQSKIDAAVPYLQSALDDSDSEVRYNAVFGIAMIKGDPKHAPSIVKFAEDEQAYVEYWKEKLNN
ncbi:MAG: HEAT repeat domain-containing protein [Armatimonadota bacterium]|jgi:hypothetical protein